MTVYLIGVPENGNIGDLAIEYFSKKFLKARFPMSSLVLVEEFHSLPLKMNDDDIVYFQGGGNIGDIYNSINSYRLQAISRFPDNKKIILPQTVNYLNDYNLLGDISKIKDFSSNLEVQVRDQASYDKLISFKPSFKVSLHKDMVDNIENFKSFKHVKTGKIGYCFRNDVEGNSNISSNISMMAGSRSIPEEDREKIVLDKINEINSYAEIYTDRLHCYIIAHNLGIPIHWTDTSFKKISSYVNTWHSDKF